MIARRNKIKTEIASLRILLSKQPTENLICAGNGKYVKWYVRTARGKKYLSKKDIKVAKTLANKKYLTLKLNDLLCEERAISLYLKARNKSYNQASKLLSETSHYRPLLLEQFQTQNEQLKIWQNSSFETNPYYTDQLIHNTFSGRFVRSKSEVIIDNALTLKQIPFRYEAVLDLQGIILYPDFTIMNPSTGELIYWEHFGMMDNQAYSNNAFAKMQLYTQNNILPSVNLITTFETKRCPLTVKKVENIIEFYFERNT